MQIQQAEERVLIFTEGEQIEGVIFRRTMIRLSDAFNLQNTQDEPFLKIKNATITCRRTGQELVRSPFLMVARSRIVLVITQ